MAVNLDIDKNLESFNIGNKRTAPSPAAAKAHETSQVVLSREQASAKKRSLAEDRILTQIQMGLFPKNDPEKLAQLATRLYDTPGVHALSTSLAYPSICPPFASRYFALEQEWAQHIKTLTLNLNSNSSKAYERLLPLCTNLETLHLLFEDKLENGLGFIEKLKSFRDKLKPSVKVHIALVFSSDAKELNLWEPVNACLQLSAEWSGIVNLKMDASSCNDDLFEALNVFEFEGRISLLKARTTPLLITYTQSNWKLLCKYAPLDEMQKCIPYLRQFKDEEDSYSREHPLRFQVLKVFFPDIIETADMCKHISIGVFWGEGDEQRSFIDSNSPDIAEQFFPLTTTGWIVTDYGI